MTTPTKEELAPHVPPLIREYIDAAIADAISVARMQAKTQLKSMEQTHAYVESRLGEMEQFERQVRSHLGIFVPEAPKELT